MNKKVLALLWLIPFVAHANNVLDNLPDATASSRGIATAAQVTKLNGIAAGAQVYTAGTGLTLTVNQFTLATGAALANLANGSIPDTKLVSTFVHASGDAAPSFTTALAIASGGTGSTSQNFVDLTTAQSVGGAKTFTTAPTMSGGNITSGTIANAALANGAVANLSGTNSGDLTLGAFGATPGSSGASLSGQVLTLQPFDTTHPGSVKASGGGTTNFLRADGTFAAPPGTTYTAGTGLSLAAGQFALSTPVSAANGGTGVTSTNALTLVLSLFTSGAQGVVPASGGGTSTFLRADGAWATPGGGGNVSGPGTSTVGHVATYNNTSGTLLADSGVSLSGSNTGDVTLGAVGASPSSNAASLSGQVLTLQPYDSTHPGVETTGNQTSAGIKTFSSPPVMSGASITSATVPIAALVTDPTNATNITSGTLPNARLVSVPLSALAAVGAHSYVGNNTGASASPAAFTNVQLTADLSLFTSLLQGLVPASGGGSSNFLRADGTWVAPAGSVYTAGTGLALSGGAFSLATIPTNTVLGNVSGSTAAPSSVTGTQLLGVIPTFTSGASGLVPGSGGGTATFLRADGTFATPAGSTPVTTKGDLFGYSTGATRIPVGSDTLILTADSTATTGVSWQSMPIKSPVRASTVAPLPGNAYNNGTAGVGATLTGISFGALILDSITLSVGDRILVKNEATGANNGLYTLTTQGSTGIFYQLTRATDFDISAKMIPGSYFIVKDGASLKGHSYVFTNNAPPTVGTTALVFTPDGDATSSPVAYGYATRDINANTAFNNVIANFASTITAAGTTTLLGSSAEIQEFTGSTTQTLVLPDATTLKVFTPYSLRNNSTGAVSVQTNGGAALFTLQPQTSRTITNTSIATTAGTWSVSPAASGGGITALTGDVAASGTGSVTATIQAGAVTAADLATNAAGSNLSTSTADVSVNTHKLTNVVDPGSAQDAATKNYVDTTRTAQTYIPVQLIATSALSAGTYSNGTAGVGATFTETANGQVFVDSQLGNAGDLILVIAQASGFQNGLYVVTQAGSASLPFILTRSTLFDTAAKMVSGTTFVAPTLGLGNTGVPFVFKNNPRTAITVGTTVLTFAVASRPVIVNTTFGSTPNTAGLSVAVDNSGNYALQSQPASGSSPGMVSATTQTFNGVKTFASAPVMSGASITSSTIPLAALTGTASNATGNSLALRDGNANAQFNEVAESYLDTVSSATPVTLSIASAGVQHVSGTAPQTILLPDATTLVQGWHYLFKNRSTGTLTVQNNAGTVVTTLANGQDVLLVYTVYTGTAAGTWEAFAPKVTDANGNVAFNNANEGYATTATAAGTTTLTVASAQQQFFTGTTTQTVALPSASTLYLGFSYRIVNVSTGALAVNDGGGSLVKSVAAATEYEFTCTNIGSTAGAWVVSQYPAGGGGSSPLTTKGDIFVRSASGDARQAAGADGLTLVYDSTQANGVRASGPNAAPNVSRDWFEDWVSDTTAGNLAMTNAVSGTGAAVTLSNTNSTFDHPGTVQITTGTTTTGSSGLYFGKATSMWKFSTTQGVFTMETTVKTPTALSNSTDRYWIASGWDSSAVGAIGGAGALGLVYSDSGNASIPNLSVPGNGNWEGFFDDDVSHSGVLDTGVAVVANTWYTLKTTFNRNAASVTWCVTPQGSSTTCVTKTGGLTVPFGAAIFISPLKIEKALGTTSIAAFIDWFHLHVDM